MTETSSFPLGLVLAVIALLVLAVLATRGLTALARRVSGVAAREARERAALEAALRAPDWAGYEAWLGWTVPEAFKRAYRQAAGQSPPRIDLGPGGFVLAAIARPAETDEDVAVAWDEDGAPAYFKRGPRHAGKLYCFADGEESVLVDDVAVHGPSVR